ncbi:MAG TPA: pyridoxine 5'-phosphate synthase [Gammaproteobacteria bacterium]|nr:pyridoxine 5'-phosphate synthase [Gammaproteobacteria bacterium]
MPNAPFYLGVNIDHVATLRQQRHTRYPDPVEAVYASENGGADGITVHLREDRRHIQERDIELIQAVTQTRMNLEMAVTDAMLAYAEKIKPPHCCFVPERREELTTEGGLDVVSNEARVRDATNRMKAINSEVSLFIDPDIKQIEAALRIGAPAIEIHTGAYADAWQASGGLHGHLKPLPNPLQAKGQLGEGVYKELVRIEAAVKFAHNAGLIVNAGHGLHYHNVQPIAAILELNELNIGHGIVARALFCGLQTAVREMKDIMLATRLAARHKE